MPMAYDFAPRTIQAGSSSSGLESHFDFLPPPLSPSDADSVPRTPDGLIPGDLPPDPKQAVFALAQHHHHHLKNVNIKARPVKQEHSPAPPAPPTISTFSASSSNHIHIVQEYIHGGSSGGKQNRYPAASGPLGGVANPFCTNSLHNFMPGMGGGHGSNMLAPGQPPRPANAWILYRSDKMKDLKPTDPAQPRPAQADISKLIAAMWKNEAPEERQKYEHLSDMKKAEHLAQYPGYRFQPMKKADRDKVRAERKAEKDRERAAVAMAKSVRKTRKRGEGEEAHNPITFVSTPGPTIMEGGTPVPVPPPTSYGPRPGSAGGAPSVTTPTARTHNFAYAPYAVPSFEHAGSPVPRMKRSRKATKTESATPAFEHADPQDSEFAHMSAHMHPTIWEQGEGAPLLDFTGYNSPSQPQLSSGSSSDINSHPTPPYSTIDPNMASGGNPTPPTNEHALAATLESIGGENDIFQFTNFDASSFLANPGADIDITLPSDFSLDFMGGVGLGFTEFGMFENQGQYNGVNDVDPLSGGFNGQGMGLGPFADIEGLNGLNADANGQDGATNHGEMVYNNSTNPEYGQNFEYTHMSNPPTMQQQRPQHPLSISTQLMQQHNGPLSAMSDFTSPIDPPPSASSYYSFASTPSYTFHSGQGYASPPNSHMYTSPPPLAQIDEEPMTAHPQSLQAARGTRRADNTWR